jgi:2',3'-cyclic-nucleotide 2'-phosphodiesterase (5'-nucleotidase family)
LFDPKLHSHPAKGGTISRTLQLKIGQRWPEDGMRKCQFIFERALNPGERKKGDDTMKRLAVMLVFVFLFGSVPDARHSSTSAFAADAIRTARPIKDTQTLRRIIILYTSDEHGRMEATRKTGGVAGLMGLWREKEGYKKDGPFLILSGGDMWTGPAISTWFKGKSMVDVMNLMGYSAAAIGNHEFDFGIDGLSKRKTESKFPILSSNIRDEETNAIADIAAPYVIKEVNGVRVGVIGLTTLASPRTTKPENISGLGFISYKEALEQIVPGVKADGAELLVVVAHICFDEMLGLASTAAQLGIAVIGGGHCHELLGSVVNKVAFISGGGNLEAYGKVDLTFDTAADMVVTRELSLCENIGGAPDSKIAAAVKKWRAQTDRALSRVIGYTKKGIDRHSHAMFNMITDAWLAAYPAADVSLTNRGGFRQSIPAGKIMLSTIIGVLPFNNVLVDVEMTGAQLIENIECCRPLMGGMTTLDGYRMSDGTPISPVRWRRRLQI